MTRPARLRLARSPRQRGAAILTAMLLVTLVASLSTAALWQQWRSTEVESAERARLQSAWILQGALDWARLILREDARSGATDHLAEPWAVALQEARLSTFLASDRTTGDTVQDIDEAFLSGQISDLQARLNILNLVQDGSPHGPSVQAFARLFEALHLPEGELSALLHNLQQTLHNPAAKGLPAPGDNSAIALLPRSAEQLGWLGLSPASVAALAPYVVVLPERTAVNLNTASALVLHACIDALSLGDARRLVAARAQSHFRTLGDAGQALGQTQPALVPGQHSVNSRFFEVRGQLRLGSRVVQERSVVQREGLEVHVLWRERGVLPPLTSVQ